MTNIKQAPKKDVSTKIYVVSDLKKLTAKEFKKEERDYLGTKLKEDFSYTTINRYSELIYVVKSGKDLNFLNCEKMRQEGAKIAKDLNSNKIKEVLIIDRSAGESYSLSEGIALANYQFLKYFTDAKKKENSLKTIFMDVPTLTAADLKHLSYKVEANLWARDMVNEPLSFLTAEQFAKEFKSQGKKAGFKVTVFNKKKIESLKMGGLLAVNKGSIDPPTFTIMEHKPAKARNKQPLVLVGKGVVYDTGGLSLKPTASSMDIMKCDMGGAAAVAGAMYAITKANLPVHVIALVPATDNRPSGNAYAPGDVIRMMDGTRVEVLNTDAEGRMILADALCYAKKYKPELVIDMATLTGAAIRAIGSNGMVIMGNADDKVFEQIEFAGHMTHERTVRFPFWDDYADQIKSKIADIKNLGGANAGMITAGKFLEHFTDHPYVHIDIAAPAWNDAASGYLSHGGSGNGVRMMFEFVKNYKK